MFSARMNKLTGAIPEKWDTPSLELLLLQDNQLTGVGRALAGGACTWCQGGAMLGPQR